VTERPATAGTSPAGPGGAVAMLRFLADMSKLPVVMWRPRALSHAGRRRTLRDVKPHRLGKAAARVAAEW